MLSDDAELVYRRALDVLWQANALQMPSNRLKLAQALARGWQPERFEKAWNEIQTEDYELLKTTKDGLWVYSERLKLEAEKIQNICNIRKKAAIKGGKASAKAKGQPKGQPKGQANVGQTSTHTHTHTDKRIKKEIYKERKSPPKKFNPPTQGEVQEYFTNNGHPVELAKRFFDYYESGKWHDQTGRPVKNWKQKAIAVWFKSEDTRGANGTHRHQSRVDRNNAALAQARAELGIEDTDENGPDNGCIDVVGRTPKARLIE
jgi:hypothetical protein